MAVAGLSSLLTEVETAVGASRSDAVDAAVKAFRANAPPLEVIRAAARGVASHYDRTSGVAPRSLAILAAATNLTSVMQPRFQALPVLQSIAYAASEKKASAPAKAPLIVSGEVTHLGRSFLFAVRAGDVAEAESIFLGMVEEGWERKMAGDMLFRAALEDMGEGGLKLFLAVKSWQLARAIGFKDARRILRPAVDYLVKGPRDHSAFETILAVLGKEWVDLEALSSGGRAREETNASDCVGPERCGLHRCDPSIASGWIRGLGPRGRARCRGGPKAPDRERLRYGSRPSVLVRPCVAVRPEFQPDE